MPKFKVEGYITFLAPAEVEVEAKDRSDARSVARKRFRDLDADAKVKEFCGRYPEVDTCDPLDFEIEEVEEIKP